jgi:hypothetical protein
MDYIRWVYTKVRPPPVEQSQGDAETAMQRLIASVAGTGPRPILTLRHTEDGAPLLEATGFLRLTDVHIRQLTETRATFIVCVLYREKPLCDAVLRLIVGFGRAPPDTTDSIAWPAASDPVCRNLRCLLDACRALMAPYAHETTHTEPDTLCLHLYADKDPSTQAARHPVMPAFPDMLLRSILACSYMKIQEITTARTNLAAIATLIVSITPSMPVQDPTPMQPRLPEMALRRHTNGATFRHPLHLNTPVPPKRAKTE